MLIKSSILRLLKVSVLLVFMFHEIKAMENKSVIIIGAGISGVSAAVKLIENGFDVKILEASDRIGGRLHSVSFGSENSTIDMGAQWVSAINEVYELLKDHFEFGNTYFTEDRIFYLSTGDDEIDQEKCRRLSTMGYEIWEMSDEMVKSNETFGEFFTRKYLEGAKKFNDIDEKLVNGMLRHHEREFNSQYASTSWHQLAAKFVPVGDPGLLAMTWKTHGYRTLLDFVTKKRPDPTKEIKLDEKIFFNKKVVNIDWKTEKITVKCEDQSEFSANHVISTIPHGVLKKQYASLFTPSLPDDKINAINEIEFGTLGKIFFEFEERLNPEDVAYYSYLWSENELKEIQGTDKEWLTNIAGFLEVDEYPKFVEFLIAGDRMLEFETMDESKLVDDCMWFLEKLFKQTLKRPISVKRTKWLTNENFLGSYSFHALTAQDNTVERLAAPIRDGNGIPVLLFAGEATDLEFMGYVNGGMRAGLRAAQEIFDFYD